MLDNVLSVDNTHKFYNIKRAEFVFSKNGLSDSQTPLQLVLVLFT